MSQYQNITQDVTARDISLRINSAINLITQHARKLEIIFLKAFLIRVIVGDSGDECSHQMGRGFVNKMVSIILHIKSYLNKHIMRQHVFER